MSTPNYYRERIQAALEFIDAHLHEKFTASDVAQAASFSEYHFHRLFRAYTSESIHQYVSSRRLEQAAQMLLADPTIRLLDLAIEVGFETHSAFSRAFKQAYGISPTQFKKLEQPPTSRHSFKHSQPMRPHSPRGTGEPVSLTPQIRHMPQLHFSYRIGTGVVSGHFFDDVHPSPKFDDLAGYVNENLIGFISAFPASPQSLNDLSVQVWYGGLFMKKTANHFEEHTMQFGAGRWAVFEYIGAYEYLHQIWSQIYRGWLPASGYSLRDTPPFESYLNNPREVSPEELLTEIWLPIE